MRNHTQLKIFFAAVLIALTTFAIVTIPAQVAGAGQSNRPTVVALPSAAGESAQALQPVLPGTSGAERVAVSRSQKRTINSRATSPGSSVSFLPAMAYASGGTAAYSVAVADVNGDGKPDLVVTNYCGDSNCAADGSVSVLLGNGDGTFRRAVAYDSGGPETYTVAVADVNGDGRPDLVVANFGNNSVGVLLGNGDGTFRPVVTYPSSAAGSGATCPDAVAIADLNADSKPDIVVTNYCGESYITKQVGILLGNGDGTFRPAVDYGSGGESPYSVVVEDVNGDGKPDLLVPNWLASFQDAGQGSVGVLMGNGDGTFQPAIAYDSGGTLAYSLAVSDVNGDGKPDLAVANCAPTNSYACPNWGGSGGRGVVGILLGNGDGTFQQVVTYDSGGLYATSVAIADVNADGRPDLLVTDWCASNDCGITGRGAVGVLFGQRRRNLPAGCSV